MDLLQHFWRDTVGWERAQYDEGMADQLAKKEFAKALQDVKDKVRAVRSEVQFQMKSEKVAKNDNKNIFGQGLHDVFRKAGIEDVDKSRDNENEGGGAH